MTFFKLSSFALRTYRREERPPSWDPDLIIEIGRPVRLRRRDRLAQAIRPSQGDGWTCPRCRRSTFTHAAVCGYCGSSRWTR